MKLTKNGRLIVALKIVIIGGILFVTGHALSSNSSVTNTVVSYSGAIIGFLGLSWLIRIVKSEG